MSGVIVHEWLAQHGGSENVVVEMAKTFPDAPIQCLWDDAPERFAPGRVRDTWLARTPLRNHKSAALPFMPATWRALPKTDVDWLLCSSHLFAHHARFGGLASKAPKFVYAYTPARYIWTPELDRRGSSLSARVGSALLKPLDRHRAQEAHSVAAISNFVADRIREHWGVESTVIYPPVDVSAFVESSAADLTDEERAILSTLPTTFVLGASRFIPYKQLELVISLGLAADVHVVLAGDGPSLPYLRAQADERPGLVTFVPRPSHAMLNELYRRALVYMFPPVEDFGIMPVEAMATGTPVIARSWGGAAETVVDNQTGALFQSEDPASLVDALERAVKAKPADCIARAWEYDATLFRGHLERWVTL